MAGSRSAYVMTLTSRRWMDLPLVIEGDTFEKGNQQT